MKYLATLISVVLSTLAFLLSLCIFIFQFSPLLIVKSLDVSNDGQKMYIYVQNIGGVRSFSLKGALTITSHSEPEIGQTAGERVLIFKPLDVEHEAFYPGGEGGITVVSVPIKLQKPLHHEADFVYASLFFRFPLLELSGFKTPGVMDRTYEGVFMYSDGAWVKHGKTHLPDFFKKIFNALRQNQSPAFS